MFGIVILDGYRMYIRTYVKYDVGKGKDGMHEEQIFVEKRPERRNYILAPRWVWMGYLGDAWDLSRSLTRHSLTAP